MARSIVLVLVLALVTAGCAGTESTPSDSAPSGSTGSEPSTPSAEVPTSLTVVLAEEPPTLDRLSAHFNTTFAKIGPNMVETLVVLNPETRLPEANLATEWVQLDPTTWRITLREGVQFHDGSTMTADDAVASLEYILRDGSPIKEEWLGNLRQGVKVDDLTIDITTEAPDPILPILLAFVSVVPASAIERGDEAMATAPIGSGPYEFVEWQRGVNITMTRFADYWGEPAHIEDVEIQFRTEPSVRVDMIRTGEAQLAESIRAEAADEADENVVIKTVPSIDVHMLHLNTIGLRSGSVLQDERVRQAVNYAIDRQALLDQLFGGYGRLNLGNPVAPSTLGWYGDMQDYPYDPDRARELLAEANAEGSPISFMCSGGNWQNDLESCDLIAAWLQAVGFEVDLQKPPFEEWLENYRYAFDESGDRPDLMYAAPGNDIFDGASRTGQQYLSLEQGGGAFTVADPDLDALILAAQQEADLEEREVRTQEAFELIRDRALNAVLLVPDFIWAMAPNLDWSPRADDLMLLSEAQYLSP